MDVIKDVDLENLSFVKGILHSDIIIKNVCLLSKGTKISEIISSGNERMEILKKWGVRSLPVKFSITEDFDLESDEIDKVLASIRKNSSFIDYGLACSTIKTIKETYESIIENKSISENKESIENHVDCITKEIEESPQILICLGKVSENDKYTFIHSLNVGLLCGYLAKHMKINKNKTMVRSLIYGGLLHDIGKSMIPGDILNKPDKLTEEEFTIMKLHPLFGVKIAGEMNVNDKEALNVVKNHHERCNGKGYPCGLTSEEIGESAKIAAVSDVFDALTSKRSYKDALSNREAISMIMEMSAENFDRNIVRTLLISVGLYPAGTIVKMSDESVGVVVQSNFSDLIRPTVNIIIDKFGKRLEDYSLLDLKQCRDVVINKAIGNVNIGTSYEIDSIPANMKYMDENLSIYDKNY